MLMTIVVLGCELAAFVICGLLIQANFALPSNLRQSYSIYDDSAEAPLPGMRKTQTREIYSSVRRP
jgi:hypothetical protein